MDKWVWLLCLGFKEYPSFLESSLSAGTSITLIFYYAALFQVIRASSLFN